MRKLFYIALLAAVLYSGLWVIAAYRAKGEIESGLEELNQNPMLTVQHEGVSVGGFPFSLNASIRQPKMECHYKDFLGNEFSGLWEVEGTYIIGRNLSGSEYVSQYTGHSKLILSGDKERLLKGDEVLVYEHGDASIVCHVKDSHRSPIWSGLFPKTNRNFCESLDFSWKELNVVDQQSQEGFSLNVEQMAMSLSELEDDSRWGANMDLNMEGFTYFNEDLNLHLAMEFSLDSMESLLPVVITRSLMSTPSFEVKIKECDVSSNAAQSIMKGDIQVENEDEALAFSMHVSSETNWPDLDKLRESFNSVPVPLSDDLLRKMQSNSSELELEGELSLADEGYVLKTQVDSTVGLSDFLARFNLDGKLALSDLSSDILLSSMYDFDWEWEISTYQDFFKGVIDSVLLSEDGTPLSDPQAYELFDKFLEFMAVEGSHDEQRLLLKGRLCKEDGVSVRGLSIPELMGEWEEKESA